MAAPSTIALPTTGTVANAGSFKVGRNQSFSGTVTLTTVADTGDPANPMMTGTLLGGATPITYSPNDVTPSRGSGEVVSMLNVSTSGAGNGIYTLAPRRGRLPYLSVIQAVRCTPSEAGFTTSLRHLRFVVLSRRRSA
jgi:hypothetical protein